MRRILVVTLSLAYAAHAGRVIRGLGLRQRQVQAKAAVAGTANQQQAAAAGQEPGDDDVPSCSCDCCDVVPRLPNEVVSGVQIKCAPSTAHDPTMCPMECRTADEDRLLEVAQGDLV